MINKISVVQFLPATACNAIVHLSYRRGIHPSVRPSHPWVLSKRCKLGSQNLHCGLPKNSSFSDKISCPWVRGFPSNKGVIEGYPLKTLFCHYWLR